MEKKRNQTEIRYLSPVDIDKRRKEKYCRFKKMGIKYIDYKDPDFLMRFLNDQGKILPRRITGTSLSIKGNYLLLLKDADKLLCYPM